MSFFTKVESGIRVQLAKQFGGHNNLMGG